MPVTLNPYLNFKDSAREALEFYHSVFGGELTVSTFADFQSAQDPSENDLIMHGQLDGPGLTLMAADTPTHMEYREPAGFSVSLSGDDDATGTSSPMAARSCSRSRSRHGVTRSAW